MGPGDEAEAGIGGGTEAEDESARACGQGVEAQVLHNCAERGWEAGVESGGEDGDRGIGERGVGSRAQFGG